MKPFQVVKAEEADSVADDDFEVNEMEEATQSQPTKPFAAPITAEKKKQPTAPVVDVVEESIGDDFVEESMEDEAQASQTFSVHDASEEKKDTVFEMVPASQTRQPGNSTVNMASVVPNAKIVSSPPSL